MWIYKLLQLKTPDPPAWSQLPTQQHAAPRAGSTPQGGLITPSNSLLPPGLVPEPQGQVAEAGALWEDPGGAEPLHVRLRHLCAAPNRQPPPGETPTAPLSLGVIKSRESIVRV